MIKNQVKIVGIDKECLQVISHQKKVCGGCQHTENCGISVINNFFKKQQKSFVVKKPPDKNLEVGDIISTEIDETILFKSALTAYITPIITAIITSFLTSLLFSTNNDLLLLTGFILGLFIYVVISKLKNTPKK
jgi:positive regulator of sigma E activity